MCQTGGPQSSPSRRAALGTGQTGEKQTNIRQAASQQANECRAFISACVFTVWNPLERSRGRRRNTELLTLPPWKVISVALQQRVSTTSWVCAVVSQTQETFMHSGLQKIAFWEMLHWWAPRVSEEPLGKMSVSAGEGGFCSVTGVTKAEPALLFSRSVVATALHQPGRDVAHARSSVQHEARM